METVVFWYCIGCKSVVLNHEVRTGEMCPHCKGKLLGYAKDQIEALLR